MSQHQLGLLGFSSGSSLFNFSLTSVEVLPLFVKLGLQVEHLPFLLLFEKFELFLDAFVKFSLLFVSLVQVG